MPDKSSTHRSRADSRAIRSQSVLDLHHLRALFRLVPWKMRGRVVLLLVAAMATGLLDLLAVATMLPLTQMLTAAGSVPPLVERFVVPLIGTDSRPTVLIALALVVGVGFLVKNMSMIVIRWWSIGEVQRASGAVQSGLFRRYLDAPYLRHRQRSRSEMLQNVTGSVPSAFTQVLLGYITVVVDGATIVLLMGLLLIMAPMGSLAAAVIFGGAALLLSKVLKPWARRFADRGLQLQIDSWRLLNPGIEGFREARIFQRESVFTGRYQANRAEFAGVAQSQGILTELPKYLLEIVMIFGILVVAFVLFLTQPEATAFGLLAVFAAAALRIVPALNRLVATGNGIRAGRAPLRAVAAEIEQLEADEQSGFVAGPQVEFPREDVIVSNAGFRYPDADSDVLSDVDVTIRPGTTVALVGASGAGKTTFADMLAGLLPATSGSISVGGINIAQHPRSWARNVAMVSQRVYLWEATIRDLITFGQPRDEVDEVLLAEVVERARLADMIAAMPDGLDTWVGDSGARVSGGQAQRIGIARALYAKPNVLILDEATSALDNETEYQVTRTIEALHGQLTVIAVAHRLSTVKRADEILFFSGGRLVDRGTLQELRSRVPEFDRLARLGSLDLDDDS